MTLYCPHCGGEVLLALAAQGQQPPVGGTLATRGPATAATPRHLRRLAPRRPAAPMCLECGERRVNQRRDGTWFDTCIRCG